MLCIAMSASAWGQTHTLSVGEIVGRMAQAQEDARQHSVSYMVTRKYELSSPGAQKPNSEVMAQISFVPPAQKDYTVHRIGGSERGAEIVRRVLERESEMASHTDLLELTTRNYGFALVGSERIDGNTCYVLQLTPKRQAPELVNGKAWIDANNFQIRRIEGVPAKNPSWWIHNLHLTINYGPVQGIWTQMATNAVADVRLMGTHVLTSRAVGLQPTTMDARNQWASRAVEHRNQAPRRAMADPAVWVTR